MKKYFALTTGVIVLFLLGPASMASQSIPSPATETISGTLGPMTYNFKSPLHWGGSNPKNPVTKFVFNFQSTVNFEIVRVTLANSEGVEFLWGGGGGSDALYVKGGQKRQITFDVLALDIANNRTAGYEGGYRLRIQQLGGEVVDIPIQVVLPVLTNEPPAPKPIKYKNCAALQKVYAGGVALSSKSVNKGGKIKLKPTVNAKVYNLNKSLDRDKDGLACER